MRTLIEEGLLGDNIVQMRIQIQCLFVPLSDMQSDFGIVVLVFEFKVGTLFYQIRFLV
jgi:hypothetical protein